MTEPRLTPLPVPGPVRGAVLVLHGGAARSSRPVDERSLSWRLMTNVADRVAPALREDGVAMFVLRYREKGWNGGTLPIQDARWALAEIADRVGDVPLALLGHSMGGRVAIHVADHPSVRRVVALAPWWESRDPVEQLRGRDVAAVHGLRDRITRPAQTQAYLERAERVARSTRFETLPTAGHYLLRERRAWLTFATAQLRAAF